MDFFYSFICLLSFLFLIFFKYSNNQIKTTQNLPPSPPKLPIIGNLHQLGKIPHLSLSQLSNKYGPAMLLHLGRVPTLVVSSAETAREVLKTHDLDCCTRAILTGPKRLSYNFLDIAFGPYSQYWRDLHRIICRAAFGKSYFGRGFDNGRFLEAVSEALALLRSFSAADYFPSLGWFIDFLSGFHARVDKSFHDLNGFFELVIGDHLDPKRPKPDHEDITDVLLRLERSEHGAVRITKDQIKAVLMNIFLAGVETSAATMVSAMTELAKNPRVMDKLQKEVRHCVGSKGKVEESDLNQLVYLKMVIKETLRFHPPGTLLIPREAIRHFKINGYDIDPKTRILVNIWAIGRDPRYWECPDEFWPERFMGRSIEFNGNNHFEFLPFGAGRRGCPGINMGTATMELALANLLYSFNWELPCGMKNTDVNMEELAGVDVQNETALYLVPISYGCC